MIAVSTGLAWVAVALAVASLVILAIPVDNAPVQHCGAPGIFLVRGTPDASLYDSNGNAKGGLDRAGLQRAVDNRCTKQVGRRAFPAAITGTAFLLVGLIALLLAYLGHRAERREPLLPPQA